MRYCLVPMVTRGEKIHHSIEWVVFPRNDQSISVFMICSFLDRIGPASIDLLRILYQICRGLTLGIWLTNSAYRMKPKSRPAFLRGTFFDAPWRLIYKMVIEPNGINQSSSIKTCKSAGFFARKSCPTIVWTSCEKAICRSCRGRMLK
jgi:hypothetical protein